MADRLNEIKEQLKNPEIYYYAEFDSGPGIVDDITWLVAEVERLTADRLALATESATLRSTPDLPESERPNNG